VYEQWFIDVYTYGIGATLHLRLRHLIWCQLEDTSGRLMCDGSSIFKLQQKFRLKIYFGPDQGVNHTCISSHW
jgi:hypothetical protein